MRPVDAELMDALEGLLTREDLPEGGASVRMLERYIAGDLSRADQSLVREQLDDDPALSEKLAVLRSEDREFEKRFPWDELRASVEARSASIVDVAVEQQVAAAVGERRYWRALLAGALGGLLGLAVAFMIGPEGTGTSGPGPAVTESGSSALGSGDRTKTAAAQPLEAFVFQDGRPQRLEAGSLLRPGTRIQFRITTTHSYLVLLGVDGTGTVSRYVPVGKEVSAPWTPGSAQPLGDALELDDAPGPEVFFAFLSEEPLLVENLEQALHDVVGEGPEGARAALQLDLSTLGQAAQVGRFHVEKE